MTDGEMKDEYVSKGERAKFYKPNVRFHTPVYLDDTIMGALAEIAERKGRRVDELLNEILKKELAIAETLR
jgi:acyl dehydratase